MKIITKKTALASAIGSIAFAPITQAYEINSEVSTTTSFDDRPLLQRSDIGLTDLSGRRSETYKTGELKKSGQRTEIERMDKNISKKENNYEKLLMEGILSINGDKVSLIKKYTANEVASTPYIQQTLSQPILLSMHDPINDLGTIVVIESYRHSDGSATMTQRFITPYYFDSKDQGGELSKTQSDIFKSKLGDNIANEHKGEGDYRHTFNNITVNGLATFAGQIMQHTGATFGIHIDNIPEQEYWKTKSGKIRVKITHHLLSEVQPNWSIYVPRDELEGGMYPMFDSNGTLVVGGMMLINGKDASSSFDFSRYFLDKTTETEKGWSGIGVAIFAAIAVATVVATGGVAGIGLVSSITPGMSAAVTFGVVGGASAISGTLTDKTTTSLGNVTSVTDKDSSKSWSDKFEKPNALYRNIALEGALARTHSSNGVEITSGSYNEKYFVDQWSHQIDPSYDISYEYSGTNIIRKQKPNPKEFFDNVHDNPNFGQNSNLCITFFKNICEKMLNKIDLKSQ